MKQRTAIVTDGEQRAALAVVRSLGAAGYRCVVAASSRATIAAASRFAARTVIVPDALAEPAAFASAILSLTAEERADLVIPIAEAALLAVLPERSRLLPAVLPFPDVGTFEAVSDKQRLLEEASKIGIPTPTQRVLFAADSLSPEDLAGLDYPVVIKPSRSVGQDSHSRVKLGVTYAVDAHELKRKISALQPAAFPILLQRRIIGDGIGIFVLLWQGKLRARFAHRRISEKPPSGGISVYRESIPVDTQLLEHSVTLLERFGWSGVAMVEYKRDQISGKCYLMEVNGRFWGSLQLAVDSGVDFPRLLVACALGEPVAPQISYRVGVRSRWWWGQIDHLVGRLSRRPSAPPLPPGTPSTARAFADLFLGPFRSADYEEVLRWSDPAPFWNETIRWMRAE